MCIALVAFSFLNIASRSSTVLNSFKSDLKPYEIALSVCSSVHLHISPLAVLFIFFLLA